jgi:predicted nucleic acid-binding protein
MTLVVDASIAAKWFIDEKGREQAIRLLDVAERQAPDLLIAEVANIVWKKDPAWRGD